MTAREDYPVHNHSWSRHGEMCDEIDRLRRHAEMLAAGLLIRGVTGDQCDALDQWLREP